MPTPHKRISSMDTHLVVSLGARRARRRAFLALVARRQRPGAGSRLAALEEQRIVMDWWTDADRALASVPHAVVGAVATNAYAPERLTRDLDLAVLVGDADRAGAALRAAGWTRQGRLGGVPGTSWSDAWGHELDLLELSEAWAPQAMAEAQENQVVGMPTVPRPYLVYMKLMASRTTDLGDVSRMLGRTTGEQTLEARAVVARWGSTADVADFDQLVRLGQLERDTSGQEDEAGDPSCSG